MMLTLSLDKNKKPLVSPSQCIVVIIVIECCHSLHNFQSCIVVIIVCSGIGHVAEVQKMLAMVILESTYKKAQ